MTAAVAGVVCGLLAAIAWNDRELALSLLAPLAGIFALSVAYDALRAQRPRLVITAVRVVSTFGSELGSGKGVGCYVFLDVVNLSRSGNAIVRVEADESTSSTRVSLQLAKVKYTEGPMKTVFNIDGAEWAVPSAYVPLPIPIAGNGIARACGAFFRHQNINGTYVPLSPTGIVVRVSDADGRQYRSVGLQPELVLSPFA